MGWSDEVLGSSGTDEEPEFELQNETLVPKTRPASLSVDEEPWYKGPGLAGPGQRTWDRSPSRSFVRNFP
jgi:hypothetical protein